MRRYDDPVIMVLDTKSRIDEAVGNAIAKASVRTWVRWTRWSPQNLVTVLAMVFAVSSLAWNVLDGLLKAETIANLAMIAMICALTERASSRMRGLSARPPTALAMARACGWARRRWVLVLFIVGSVGIATTDPTRTSILETVQALAYGLCQYVMTMGRPWPPAKPERQPLRARLPRLATSTGN